MIRNIIIVCYLVFVGCSCMTPLKYAWVNHYPYPVELSTDQGIRFYQLPQRAMLIASGRDGWMNVSDLKGKLLERVFVSSFEKDIDKCQYFEEKNLLVIHIGMPERSK